MIKRGIALDLFCAAGGASMGLSRAGFEVVGIDIQPQPRYPFKFIKGDALKPPLSLKGFDFIWASPPCQAHSSMKTMHNAKKHESLIVKTREMLKKSGVPYVIENVVGAPLKNPIMLCGTMFGLGAEESELRRHRIFECSRSFLTPQCSHNADGVIGIYGGHVRNRRRLKGERGVDGFPGSAGRRAMQIEWMTLNELSQAIPPAYSEFIVNAMLPV